MEQPIIESFEAVLPPQNATVPIIYMVNSPEHPLNLTAATAGLGCAVASVPIRDWNNSLTPWPAAGLYREEPPLGGHAARTLDKLVHEHIPAFEGDHGLSPAARAIGGYSLGGLFSLYALTHSDAFDACACVSGSVWYEGWSDHLQGLTLNLEQRFAFLSVGTKEKRAARPILRTVEDKMGLCSELLEKAGCEVVFKTGPGNHMQFVDERITAALTRLDEFMQHS